MKDLLLSTAELVDIPSVSFSEAALVSYLEEDLRSIPGLTVERLGDNLVARTELGRSLRLILAGHTDTVPGDSSAGPRIDGDTLWGLGAADMKGGLAVMLELAHSIIEPPVDVTWIFYAREEIAREHSGLLELSSLNPALLRGDLAILGEPTGGVIEAGCQGTMRFEVIFRGRRAHSARPWMGRNAIHRAGALLSALDFYEYREPCIEGCHYREALQAVRVEGGIAGNVVPDETMVQLNHRYAPDRTGEEAESHVRTVLSPFLEPDDTVELVDHGAASMPQLGSPLLARLIGDSGLDVRAKLGWTDVAFFAENGVPAVNLGPGDPVLAHAAEERIERQALEAAYRTLKTLIEKGV